MHSLMSSSVAVTQYHCSEQPNSNSDLRDMLRRHSFRPIDQGVETKSVGWVSAADMLDSNFLAAPDIGEFLLFSLRIDLRKLNSAVLKKEVIVALKTEEEKNRQIGKKFICRDRKKEIKEQVTIRLLSHTYPIPKTVGVAWHLSENKVYFFSSNSKECDLFEELFTKTFDTGRDKYGISLNKIDFYGLATDCLPSEDAITLDSILSQYMLAPSQSDSSILGADFLNYLWYTADQGATFAADDITNFSIAIGKSVTVSGEKGSLSATSSSFDLPEAIFGISKGKNVRSLSLTVETAEATKFQAKLGESYTFSGVKLPKSESNSDEVDEDALILERLFLLEQLISMVSSAFMVFIKIRIDVSEWNKMEVAIREWASNQY